LGNILHLFLRCACGLDKAACSVVILAVIEYWSTTAWDSQISLGTLYQGSLPPRKLLPAHREVIMVSQKHESTAVIMVVLALILAVVWLCYLVSRSS